MSGGRLDANHAGSEIAQRIPCQAAQSQRQRAELQHLVVHGRAQAAEQDVRKYKHGRDDGRRKKTPSKNHLQDQRHRVQPDAGDQYSEHSKRERIEDPCRLAKAHFKKLRHAPHFAAVVNRHHHQCRETASPERRRSNRNAPRASRISRWWRSCPSLQASRSWRRRRQCR